MPTRAVETQSHRAFTVETAALSYADLVTGALERRLPQPLPPPPVEPPPDDPGAEPAVQRQAVVSADALPAPDWVELQGYIAYQLRVARQRLLAADNEREREVHEDPEARALRDRLAGEGYDELVRTRQALRAALGDEATLKILGVEGSTPQKAVPLLQRLQEAVFRLRKAEMENVELLLPWMSPDWGQLISRLEESAERLEEAILGVSLGNRGASGALVERERISVEVRDVVNGLTLMLDGIYRLAGRNDLSERIRPTIASPANDEEKETPDPDGGEPPDGGEEPDDGPPDGGSPDGVKPDGEKPPADEGPPDVAL
jgi:hypothetical protein